MTSTPMSPDTGVVVDLDRRRDHRDLSAAVETVRLLVRAIGRPELVDLGRDQVAVLVRDGIDIDAVVPPPVATTLRRVRADVDEMLQEHLAPSERDVLRARFGLADGAPRSLVDVAAEVRLSPPAVAEVEARALSRLRHPAFQDILEACFGG